ncbi:hypothetical protein ACFLV4_03485 [Chloroflexota bacterium]
MTNSTNDLDSYMLLKSLGKYLNSDVGITCGKITRNTLRGSGRQTIETAGYDVKATISNTAPTELDYPMIVFMGVGLKIQFPNTSHRTMTRMRNENSLKVDLSNASQQNPFPQSGAINVDTPEYPPLTSDEKQHGHVLFPGQSIKYELSITAKECPDVKELKLWAEGTISRRHLFHQSKEIVIAGESIVYQL